MDMTGEERIAAPRAAVWAALNDPEVLRPCIPGCDRLEWISPTQLAARVKIKIGPLSASFSGDIALSNMKPPVSYTISAEGRGGLAGFAKGAADVSLHEDGGETILRYVIRAEAGGRIAKLGGKLVDAAASKLARNFFADFTAAAQAKQAAG